MPLIGCAAALLQTMLAASSMSSKPNGSAVQAALPMFTRTRPRPSALCPLPVVLPDTSTSKVLCLRRPRTPKPATQDCVVYSFGINYQWDFDDYAHALGCEVHSFDPGMTYPSQRAARHYFEPIGLGATTGIRKGRSTLYSRATGYRVETLSHIMKRLGHNAIDILRIDIESAEWEVLHSLPWGRIRQLSIEIHMWHMPFHEYAAVLAEIPLVHVASYQNTDWLNPHTLKKIHPNVTGVYEMTFVTADASVERVMMLAEVPPFEGYLLARLVRYVTGREGGHLGARITVGLIATSVLAMITYCAMRKSKGVWTSSANRALGYDGIRGKMSDLRPYSV